MRQAVDRELSLRREGRSREERILTVSILAWEVEGTK